MSADLLSRPPRRYFWLYTAGFCALLASLAILEHEGFPRFWLGYLFLFTTIVVYAAIGVFSRTSDLDEYYVAGRRIPPVFNGMATAADWISTASFIGLAGGLYLHGLDGLAYILGWTGGFCLIALLIAPYLRRLGQYTVPDYLAARYAGTDGAGAVRAIAVIATLIISFTYVVVQIYGVGLITSRFTGIDFSVGIFLGLASILVCSFLGGMRAITWTQIAQYVIVIIALMIPVSWLALKQTGIPLPQIAYGTALERLAKQEQALTEKDSEQQVRKMYLKRAQLLEAKIASLPSSWNAGRAEARKRLQELQTSNASLIDIKAANRALADYPKSPDAARRLWERQREEALARAQPLQPHAQAFAGSAQVSSDVQRNNFLALVFCLMLHRCFTACTGTLFHHAFSTRGAQLSILGACIYFVALHRATCAGGAGQVRNHHYFSWKRLCEFAVVGELLGWHRS